jgi:hypothetical protein
LHLKKLKQYSIPAPAPYFLNFSNQDLFEGY